MKKILRLLAENPGCQIAAIFIGVLGVLALFYFTCLIYGLSRI